MRDISDKISSDTQDMTFEELKAYIKKKFAKNGSRFMGNIPSKRSKINKIIDTFEDDF